MDIPSGRPHALIAYLGLKLNPDLKWNLYIQYIAKDIGEMVGSLHQSSKYLTYAALLYLYKKQIRPK